MASPARRRRPAARGRFAQGVRYQLDNRNRLIVEKPRDALAPRRVLDGRWRINQGNRLVYRITAGDDAGTARPRILTFDGTWGLSPEHELTIALHEQARPTGQTLYFRGALVETEGDALTFALVQREEGGGEAQRLSLSGRWQADDDNRLTFAMAQAGGREDRMTLDGGWELGPDHALLYRYEQRQLGLGRRRDKHVLRWSGAWDIAAKDRLVYRVAGSTDSAFEFSAALQSPTLMAREGRLTYQVGIGLSGGRREQRRVTLVGTWKLNRDLSVSFDVPYADGRVQSSRFEGAYALGSRDRVSVALQSQRHEPLGVTVTFTKDLIPDAGLFLRIQKTAEEQSVIGGVQVRF